MSDETEVLAALKQPTQATILSALRRARDGMGREALISDLRRVLPRLQLGVPQISAIGSFLRATFSAIGPIQPAPSQPDAMQAYLNVLGTSHVRVFGCRPYFFPVFAAMGPDLALLREEEVEAAIRRVEENLIRLDTRHDVLLVLGGEALCHVGNYNKTRPEIGPVTQADRDLMQQCLRRYERLLSRLRPKVTGRLAMLNALPTYDVVLNELAQQLNVGFRELCPRFDTIFMDIWPQLVNPDTGLLHRGFAAEAYNEDVHLGEAAIPVIEAALRSHGLLNAGMLSAPPSTWSYVFSLPISPGGETRLWSETNVIPANALRSEKVAAAQIGLKALDFLLPLLLAVGRANLLVLNAREAFLAMMMPTEIVGRCTALVETPGQLSLARRIARFCGRTDLDIQLFEGAKVLKHYDIVLAVLHPDTSENDLQRVLAALAHVSYRRLAVIAPTAEAAEPLRKIGFAPQTKIAIGNRLLPERWRASVLLL